jgi:hypothetical protein
MAKRNQVHLLFTIRDENGAHKRVKLPEEEKAACKTLLLKTLQVLFDICEIGASDGWFDTAAMKKNIEEFCNDNVIFSVKNEKYVTVKLVVVLVVVF